MQPKTRIQPNDQPMREIRPLRLRYADLFPPCAIDGCNDIAEGYDSLCNHHSYEREYEQRQQLQRQARAAGR